MTKKKQAWPPEIRKAAIREALNGTDPYSVVARRYGVPPKTLYTWLSRKTILSKATIAGPEQPAKKEETKMEVNTEATATEAVKEPAADSTLAALRKGLDGLEAFIDAFAGTDLLDLSMSELSALSKDAQIFVAGAEYMEGRHD